MVSPCFCSTAARSVHADLDNRISLNISYPLEILPFNIRANGLLMQNIATYVCLFLNQYLIPIGIEHGSWK